MLEEVTFMSIGWQNRVRDHQLGGPQKAQNRIEPMKRAPWLALRIEAVKKKNEGFRSHVA